MFLGTQDAALSTAVNLPAAGGTVITGILDFETVGGQSDSWRLGRLAVTIPAMPARTDSTKSITIAMQCAPPSLTTSPVAPQLPVPGTFVTPNPAQTVSVPGVATTGSPAQVLFFDLATDGNNSTYQFYQFVVTVPSGDTVAGQTIVVSWMDV